MEQSLTIIEKENVFKYYDKIFTLRYFWDLMEKNNVEMSKTTNAREFALGIIDLSYSDSVFANIKNYGKTISFDKFKSVFSDKVYKKYVTDESLKDLDSNTQEAIKDVLLKNKDKLTMLDYNIFLADKISAEDFSEVSKNVENLKVLLETSDKNICILAYFLAIYNTYITGLILKNSVGIYANNIMKDTKNIYYTSAKIITLLPIENTLLCDESEFCKITENYANSYPKTITAKDFNYFQLQRICWTAYSLGITEYCSENELLYILLSIGNSSFVKAGLKDLNVEKYKELLESHIKSDFQPYVF